MEQWQLEIKRLDKIRLDLGLNWNQLEKITGKQRDLLQRYFDFKSVPGLKVYFEIKIALENEFEVRFPVEMVVINKPCSMGMSELFLVSTDDSDCDCKLENGLLKRGKIKCKKTKEEHNF